MRETQKGDNKFKKTYRNFHTVKFPFKSNNIPSAPAYGIYGSQLISYARCCSNYSDFLSLHIGYK